MKKRITAMLLAGVMALSLSACGTVDTTATVATVGDVELSYGYLSFCAHYMQSTYDSFFASYYGEDYWTNESYVDSDGLTMEESVKEYVLEDIELQCLLEAHMDDYGVEITDEDWEEISAAAAEFIAENTDEALAAMDATQEVVELYLYYATIESRMEEAIKATADGQLDIADYARRTFSYVEIDVVGYYDDDGEYVEYTEDELESLMVNIELLAVLAQADLDTAAETYEYTVYSYSYGEDEDSEEDGGFCDAVIAAADAMSEGDISEIIECDDYYYIIRLDSEDDTDAQQDAYDSAMSTLESEIYSEVTEGYQEESDFTIINEKLWAKVRFNKLFSIDNTEDDDLSE